MTYACIENSPGPSGVASPKFWGDQNFLTLGEQQYFVWDTTSQKHKILLKICGASWPRAPWLRLCPALFCILWTGNVAWNHSCICCLVFISYVFMVTWTMFLKLSFYSFIKSKEALKKLFMLCLETFLIALNLFSIGKYWFFYWKWIKNNPKSPI